MKSLITKEIVINDTIVYIPAKRVLKNILTEGTTILHTPANYCLLHLIASGQKLQNKTELIRLSWPDTSQVISDNTYYQMVFNLRQSLERVGGQDVIVTVPRRGLQINPDISIKVNDKKICKYSEKTHKILRLKLHLPERFSAFIRSSRVLVIVSGVLLTLSGLLFITIPDEDIFSDYHSLAYEMCSVRYNEKIRKEKVSFLLQKALIDCTIHKKIILTLNENDSRLSVIQCPTDSRTRTYCSLSLFVQ